MRTWTHIAACLDRGEPCALVTVARVDGSTPREAGARMVIAADMSFHGTIGGGTLEFEIIRKAARAAKIGRSCFSLQTVSLGPDLGQCCGGRARIAVEVFTQEKRDEVRRLAELEAGGSPFTTQAVATDGAIGPRRVLDQSANSPFLLHTDQKSGAELLVERFGEWRRPLFLFGAGHVGKALVLALAQQPFEVTWIDSRKEQFPGPVPANTRKIAATDPAVELDRAPADAFVLAMTHSHALDEDIMARALLLQRFAYCGVIGSATKRARFRNRLKSRGLDEALIANMICPVGVTALKSKQPAAIAAGIAVDLLIRDEELKQQAAAGGRLAQN
ncbi:xanthine dehydrogenase accessory protein XdhC [Roseibium sp.]|uniref:xanthine dehydrogenase accessory protein XdhC n=1 Tax=Roseibium sp. TaxID=1936156 RepID=UPI003BB0F516